MAKDTCVRWRTSAQKDYNSKVRKALAKIPLHEAPRDGSALNEEAEAVHAEQMAAVDTWERIVLRHWPDGYQEAFVFSHSNKTAEG